MARKGNHQRNGLDRKSANHKNSVSEPLDGSLPVESEKVGATKLKVVNGEELPNSSQPSSPSMERGNKTKHTRDERKNNQKSRNESRKKKAAMDGMPGLNQSASMSDTTDILGDLSASESSELKGEDNASLGNDSSSKNQRDSSSCLDDGLPNADEMKNSRSFDTMVGRNLGASALATLKVATEWIQKQKPLFTSIMTILLDAGKHVQLKTEKAYPIVWKWLVHFGNLMLLISMVWLDCCIRGLVSFLRLGTTSFFAVIWCSVLSVIAMIGIVKFSILVVVGALVAFFSGFTLAILVVAISSTVFLWLYGSFWTTGIVILVGGLGFALRYEYFSLLIATIYSIYCAKTYVGWLGLLLGLNLSFISSDVLIYFLKSNINGHGRSNRSQEQTAGAHGQSPGFFGESMHAPSETASGSSTDRSPGVPSTSGVDETTPGDEVVRLLNCTDHYSALGLSRYENVDDSLLKREYRRKAMLVHPDKNMGNENAAEAFKKLQNAYEVLLDSFKRKAYDDELRSEELLNLFRRSQSLSQKNGKHGPFTASFSRSEANSEDHHEDSRRIACKKCGNFHLWIHTNKSKSKARWCQECKDFHQAKDGDGWVEQSFQPFLFGLLQKVDAPTAYVCAESRIYNATEWFICQGMRCAANTHKPSFHVNTNVTTKHGFTKGSGSGQRGTGTGPTNDMDEIMTEEEFLEFLQKAMQSGMFETAGASSSTESPSTRASNSSKTSGSGSNNKKKRKGKKQW